MSDKAGRTPNSSNSGPSTPHGNNYLLAIGIDAYEHCPRLYNCIRDVEALIQLLTERYRFESQHIYTVFNANATRGNIYRAFREMAQRVTPKDNVLIYFSGHGEYDNIFKEGYWIPVEAQPGNHDQYIPNSEIRTFLSAINSHHTFLMSDSCFAGALFAKGLDKNIEKRYENDPSRWGLTAGRNEVVSDGKPGDNSPFAESLLYRLRQNTGAMGVQELCAYVTEYVQAKTNQTPIGEPLKIEGHKNGQFVFHLKKDENRDWAATQKENNLAAYERFLVAYPNGVHVEEARSTIAFLQEEAAWQQARNTHTIASYDQYLQQYRQGRYRRMAIDAQKSIEEADAWKRATERNTIPAYREFQYNYPDSSYYNDAEARIGKLQMPPVKPTVVPAAPSPKQVQAPPKKLESKAQEPIATTKKNRIPYFLGGVGVLLLLIFLVWKPWQPNTASKEESISYQDSLKNVQIQDSLAELSAFTKASKDTTIPPLQQFLQKYPDGRFADKAKTVIKDMENTVLSYLQDAQAFRQAGEYREAINILEVANQSGTDNKFINLAIDALKQKEDKTAANRLKDGIQLQLQKLTPAAPPLGR